MVSNYLESHKVTSLTPTRSSDLNDLIDAIMPTEHPSSAPSTVNFDNYTTPGKRLIRIGGSTTLSNSPDNTSKVDYFLDTLRTSRLGDLVQIAYSAAGGNSKIWTRGRLSNSWSSWSSLNAPRFFVEDSAPTSSDGEPGDVWFQV